MHWTMWEAPQRLQSFPFECIRRDGGVQQPSFAIRRFVLFVPSDDLSWDSTGSNCQYIKSCILLTCVRIWNTSEFADVSAHCSCYCYEHNTHLNVSRQAK